MEKKNIKKKLHCGFPCVKSTYVLGTQINNNKKEEKVSMTSSIHNVLTVVMVRK